MSDVRWYALDMAVGIALTTLVGVSFAVAEPGGYAWWRIALFSWPVGILIGCFIISFHQIELSSRKRER